VIGVSDGGNPIGAPVFSCATGATPAELPLPRLTRTQLQNALQFALQLANPADATAIWAQVASTFNEYPPDLITPAPGDLHGGFSRTDQSIQQAQINTMYLVGQQIGTQLTNSQARMSAVLGSCYAKDGGVPCLEAFIQSWGSRVLRYPLTTADVAFYADAGGAPLDPQNVANIIATLLNAPQMLYRVEHGTDDAGVSPLSDFELASRLSFQFWQGPPDDALWNAAVNGQLSDPAQYHQQVMRLLTSPNAYVGLDEFVSQWLRINELPPMNLLGTDPAFEAFAGSLLPVSTTTLAMIADTLGAFHYQVADGGRPSDFLSDNHSYATDPLVASIYGVPVWDGVSAPPTPSSAARAGLLTRPAMLATSLVNTRPIHKGYQVRNSLLCDQVGSPPANVNRTPPAATGSQTTRQVVTNITSGASCAGCHAAIINPAGFITESFDALGRERTVENLYSPDGGALLASLPVDTSAVPGVILSDQRTMSTAAELTSAIDDSLLYHSCLARRYFRWTYERNENAVNDSCLLSDLEQVTRSGAPLSTVLSHLVEQPNYKQKRFQ
jgi:hypothetical protein